MIIYLEGPDGSGKSTLVRILADSLQGYGKVDVEANKRIPTHPAKPGRLTAGQVFSQLKQMAKDNVIHIIDRGIISDIVYRVFDDYKPLTTMEKVISFLNDYNNRVLLIYCNSSLAKTNMLERGDDNPIAIKYHKEISKVFDITISAIEASLPFNIARYDYNSKKPENNINNILGLANYFCYMGIR